MRPSSPLRLLGLTLMGWFLSGCAAAPTLPLPSPSPEVVSVETLLDERYQAYLSGVEAYGALGLGEFRRWLEDDPPPFILDVRTAEEAEATGHIAGAVRIPLQELANRTDLLPDFDATIVTYCGSGWRCTMALPVLAALGWQSVYTLKDGSLSGWIFQGYPIVSGAPPEPAALNAAQPDPRLRAHLQQVLASLPEDDGATTPARLSQAMANGADILLLDIRSPGEVQAKGFIAWDRQLRIPIEELVARRAELPEDKATPIVTYCGSGYRCLLVMMMLRSYGYLDVNNLVGGLTGWDAAGYPIAIEP